MDELFGFKKSSISKSNFFIRESDKLSSIVSIGMVESEESKASSSSSVTAMCVASPEIS